MPISLFGVINLILFILHSECVYNSSSRPLVRQKSSLQTPQSNQCTYGGGSINNSTVIELGNCFNDFYFINLNLGTSAQNFDFQFDTGIDSIIKEAQRYGFR